MTKSERDIIKLVHAIVNDPTITKRQFATGLSKLKKAVEKETRAN